MPETVKVLILFAVISIWPVYLLIKAEYHRIRNDRAPEIRTRAVALLKEVTSDNVQYTNWGMRDGGTVFYCTFLLKDGKEVKLYMTGRNYVSFQEGDEGELLYKGTKMLSFTTSRK